MSKNMYEAPVGELVSQDTAQELAELWKRLVATTIDNIVTGVACAGLIYLFLYQDGGETLEEEIMKLGELTSSIIIVFAYFSLNGYLLWANGQSIGKKLLRIRIVKDDGSDANFFKQLVPRYILFIAFPAIPVVGWLLQFVNIVAIFAKDRKCVHDGAVGTKVIKLTS